MTTVIDLGKLRFYWAGNYDAATEYELNDVVRYGGNVYVYINVVKTIGNTPTNTSYWAMMVEGINFIGEWSSSTQYYIGDAIAYGSTVYVALEDNINKQPDLFPSIWSQFVEAIQWEGDYNPLTSYQANDVVKYGGNAYIATQTTVGHDPTNATYWDPFVTGISPEGVYNNSTAYAPNDVVAYGANLYICTANTTGNPPTDTDYWTPWISAFQNRGAWQTGTLYYVNDLVQYGANTYACQIQNTSGDFATDLGAGKWSIFVSGLRQRGEWTTSTLYLPYDIVVYGGNTYSCLVANTSGTFATDLAAGKWEIFNGGIRWRGVWAPSTPYLVNDIVRNVGSSYIATEDFTSGANFSTEFADGKWEFFAQGGEDILPVIAPGDQGYSLTVDATGAALAWINASGSTNVFYVSPDGDDANPGTSLALPFESIQAAVAAVPSGESATIFVKTGTYQEAALPIVVPPTVAIVGDNQRTVIVTPAAGLAADGVTPNNEATMFLMSNASILNKMTFTGMTGWVPGATPGDIRTSTAKGVVVALNPDSPVTTKSPYIIECAAIGSGCIGALIDGTVQASGYKSMLFHGYTIITDDGVGYWAKDGGRAEIVSCFTYYAYFGYSSSGGGIIRALNGNNSYGTWGAASFGYLASETPQTGAIYGKQLTVTADPITQGFAAGSTITGLTSGATGVVTNLQSSAAKIYYNQTSGTAFQNNEDITDGTYTLTIAADGVSNQKGYLLVADGFSAAPLPGASIQIAGDSGAYVIQSVSGTYVDSSSIMSLALAQEKLTASADNAAITIRYSYSQIRLTGHDFLNIGTGGIATTNYPNTPLQPPAQGNEVNEDLPGRVYYVSTDQDGNFRVGEYFRVDQATGTATLNANAFNLAGLTSLRLGSIGAQLGETINEFSSDATLGGANPTNLAVPTEYAVKTYVDTAIAAATDAPGVVVFEAAASKTGYLKCDGTVYAKSSYSTLAAALGNVDDPQKWTLNSSYFNTALTTPGYCPPIPGYNDVFWIISTNDNNLYSLAKDNVNVVATVVGGSFYGIGSFNYYSNATHSCHTAQLYKNRYALFSGNDGSTSYGCILSVDTQTGSIVGGQTGFGVTTGGNTKMYADANRLACFTLSDTYVYYTTSNPTGSDFGFNSVDTGITISYAILSGKYFYVSDSASWNSNNRRVDLDTGSVTTFTFNTSSAYPGASLISAATDGTKAIMVGNSSPSALAYDSATDTFSSTTLPMEGGAQISTSRITYYNGVWMWSGYVLDRPATGSYYVAFVYASQDGVTWKPITIWNQTYTTATTNMPYMATAGEETVMVRGYASDVSDARAWTFQRYPYNTSTQFMVPIISTPTPINAFIKT